MYRFSIGDLPVAFKNYFSKRSDIHEYPTRHVNDLNVTNTKKSFSNHIIRTRGPILWNSLPKSIKECKSVKHFRTLLMQPSMANLNSPSSRVVKDSTPFRRRILRCTNFGNCESLPSFFLDVVNLYLTKFRKRWIMNERAFYSFIILFIWKWILT